MGLAEAFGQGSVYGFHKARAGWLVHAPSALEVVDDTITTVRLRTQGWGPTSYSLAVANVDSPVIVLAAPPGSPDNAFAPPAFTYDATRGQLFINGLVGDQEIIFRPAYSDSTAFGLY